MAEIDIALIGIQHFRDIGCEIYQEVTVMGKIMDFVALQPYKSTYIYHAVECKSALTFAVFDQALVWRNVAHKSWVCVPALQKRSNPDARQSAYALARHLGIGVIEARGNGVNMVEARMFSRARFGAIRCNLCEKQKHFAQAGNANGDRWTPFAETCRRIADHVRQNPGASLRDVIDIHGRMHYASTQSARGALSFYLLRDMLKGVKGEKINGKWTLWPKENN